MGYLLKVLSDMLQSPQLLSHIHICPKPKVKLGPTNLIYPAPPSSFNIAIARNPNQFGHTEMGLQTLCFPSQHFGLTEMSDRSHRVRNVNSLFPFCNISVSPKRANRSHRVYLTNSLFHLLPKLVQPSLCNRSNRDEVLPYPSTSVLPS